MTTKRKIMFGIIAALIAMWALAVFLHSDEPSNEVCINNNCVKAPSE